MAIKAQGWRLDFGRFRRYLLDKYKIQKAFIFIGYLKENEALYRFLEKSGYDLIFKPAIRLRNGFIKGNVDAELVLHTMLQYPNFTRAIIVSNDGDFYCLIKHLKIENKLLKLVVPNSKAYSILFKEFRSEIVYMDLLKEKLQLM